MAESNFAASSSSSVGDHGDREIQLYRFPFSRMQPGKIILFVGKRGQGKSFLLEDILRHMVSQFDHCVGMSPTPSSIALMERVMPPSCVYTDYNEDTIINMLDTLRAQAQLIQNARHSNGYVPSRQRTLLLVFDDLMFNEKIIRSKQLKEIHNNGRHLKIFFINLAQYVMQVPKGAREQISICFCFAQEKQAYSKALFENFFDGPFRSFAEFVHVFNNITANRSTLVIDLDYRCEGVRDLKDYVFHYTAEPNPGTRYIVGGRNTWKLHHKFYRPEKVKVPSGISSLDTDGKVLALPSPKEASDSVTQLVTQPPGKPKRGSVITVVKKASVPNKPPVVMLGSSDPPSSASSTYSEYSSSTESRNNKNNNNSGTYGGAFSETAARPVVTVVPKGVPRIDMVGWKPGA